MPYSYPNNVPNPAKHWSESEKRRCVRAANAALKAGRSEEQAIYACIGAAGKSYKQVDEDGYDSVVEDGLKTFQDIVAAYFAGLITLSVLEHNFKQALEIYFVRLMVLGLGSREPTPRDLEFINAKIADQSATFDGFLVDLASGNVSEKRALWRAGMYAINREAYIFYTVPNAVVSLMEGLPGEICYGDGLCGCSLNVTFDDQGNATVDWIINPEKESCEACLDMAARSPFFFTRDQLANA